MEDSKKRKIEEQSSLPATFKLTENSEILKYKLDAIHGQMLEYKNEARRLQQRNEQLEQLCNVHQSKMGTILKYIDRFLNDLNFIGSRIGLEDSSENDEDQEKERRDENCILFEKFIEKEYSESFDENILSFIEATNSATIRVSNAYLRLQTQVKERTDWIKHQNIDGALRAVLEDNEKRNFKLERDIDNLYGKCREASLEGENLKIKDVANEKKIGDMMNQIDELRYELEKANRKIHRMEAAKCRIDVPNTNEESKNPSEAQISSPKAEEKTNLELEQLRLELNSEMEIGLGRLKEIEDLHLVTQKLEQEILKLQMDLNHIPEDKLIESPIHRHIKSQYDHYRAEYEQVKKQLESTQRQMHDMEGNRKAFRDQVEEEERDRRKLLENDLKILEVELTKAKLEKKDATEAHQVVSQQLKKANELLKESNLLCDTLKEFASCLKNNIHRLVQKEFGSLDEFRLVYFDPKDYESAIADLNKQLKESQFKEKGLRSHLEQYKNLSEDDIDKIGSLEQVYQTKISKLEDHASIFERAFGADLNPTSDSLQAKLVEKETMIMKLQANVTSCTQEQEMLMSEIESIGKAYEEIQDQNQRLIQQLTEKDAIAARFLSEKMDMDQKLSILQKELEIYSAKVSATHKQYISQTDLCKRLELREKTLFQQIAHLEKENASRQMTLEMHKRKASESVQLYQELLGKTNSLSPKLNSLQLLLKEKAEQLGKEIQLRKRAQEDIDKFKRRLEFFEQFSSGGDENLKEQLQMYRRLLKCSSCNTNDKQVVLTRCYHVFCKDCVDLRINTRQRKCPTCGDSFGMNDAHQLYL